MSSRIRLIVPALAATLLAVPTVARAQIEQGLVPLQTARTELARFRSSYAEMFNQKDQTGLGNTYADDAVWFSGDGMTYTGGAAIKAELAKRIGAGGHMIITSDTLSVFGNTGIDVGTVTFHPAAGGEMKSHYLVVLRRGYKEWKIVRLAEVPEMKM